MKTNAKTNKHDDELLEAQIAEADAIAARFIDYAEVELQRGADPTVLANAIQAVVTNVLLLVHDRTNASRITHAAAEQIMQLPRPDDLMN